MPSKKPMITLRTEQETVEKLKVIADEENRSDNKQLEYILLHYIKKYEQEHGEIIIPPQDTENNT